MSTTYFLTFLLALVVLTTITSTAGTNSGGPTLDEPKQITSHFHSKNWGKIKHHSSKSVERAHDDDVATQWAKTIKHKGARRTAEKKTEKSATDDEDRAADWVSGAKNMNLENNGRAMPEKNMAEQFVRGLNFKKTTMGKFEEGTKDKTTGYRAKARDIPKYENVQD